MAYNPSLYNPYGTQQLRPDERMAMKNQLLTKLGSM